MKGLVLSFLIIVSLLNSAIYAYTVTGTKIYDPSGKEVILRGVDRPSMEWDESGEYLSLADYTLMAGWGANVVRVALNQDYWLASTTYQALVVQQATWINSLGMGVIFDLHWNNGGQQNMADLNSITFWSQMATTFKSNSWVIFELYNEPHDVSWSVWLSGDGSSYAGMQQMYNAVRAAGAENLCLVGGLNWAFDLSGVSAGYALTGTNIAYATHPYDYDGKQAADWDAAFGDLASTYPVIMTEFGQYCADDGYVSTLLTYAESKSLHWTAWGWYVSGCSFPSIIADWSGTPTDPVGTLVKSYLSGSGSSASVSATSSSTGTESKVTASTTGTNTVTTASSSLAIYSDGLVNSFQDWSWATSYSLTDTTHVHSGTYAIEFVATNYGGVYFHTTTSFTLGSYTSLVFYVYATSTLPAADFAVVVYDSSENEITSINFPSAVAAGVWTTITIPVSSISSTLTTQVSGVAIQTKSLTSVGTLWIDDISFVASSSSSTAAASTAAASTATTAKSSTTTGEAGTSTTGVSASTATECDSSNIKITQALSNTWSQNGNTVSQYAVTISSTCTTKTLVSITLTASNWDPLGYWVATASGTTLSFPSYVKVTPNSAYTGFGYQNYGGQATFTVNSFTFQ